MVLLLPGLVDDHANEGARYLLCHWRCVGHTGECHLFVAELAAAGHGPQTPGIGLPAHVVQASHDRGVIFEGFLIEIL